MKNLKLSSVIDFIFINMLLFLISFVWIKYFSNNIFFASILSIFIIFLINFLGFFIKNKKNITNKINKKLTNDIELYMLTFLSNSNKENIDFFEQIVKNKEAVKYYKKNLITYKNSNNNIEAISPIFNSSELKTEDVLKVLSYAKQLNINKIFILCCICQTKAKLFLESFKEIEVNILTKNNIFFNLLKPANIYPDIKFEIKENKKYKIKELINISFDKAKAKKYFLTGLFIFFCSFVVKYNFYYVFMSSILFVFSLICFIKKQDNFNNILNIK